MPMNKIELITSLAEMYNAQLTDNRMSLYIGGLLDIDTDTLEQAIIECIQTSKWMPTVSEIRTAVEKVKGRPELEGTQIYWWAMGNYFKDDKAFGWAVRNCK
jgi:hypothetical protein